MKLGQGSHKRTPWWCGLIMLLVASAVIPGAKWTAAKDKQKQAESKDAKAAKAIEWPALPAAPSGADSITKVYRLKEIVDRLQKDFGLSESESKTKLEQMLPLRNGVSGSKPPFAWSGRKLVVQASVRSHERIAEAIECIQEKGTQFVIEMHIFTGPPEAMAKLKLEWKTPSEATPEAKALDFRLGSDPLIQQASATQSVETPSLMLLAEVDDSGARSALEQINKTVELSEISHPKILTILGQQASLQIGDQRPFVMGWDKADDGRFTPRVRAFFSGLAIQVLPLPYKQDQIQLDYQLQQSEITKVNNLRSREGPNPESDKVQVPTIRTSKITTTYAVKLDRTLLIRGLAPSEKAGKPVETLVMLRCTQPKPESNTSSEIKPNPDPRPQPSGPYSAPTSESSSARHHENARNVFTRTYYVADLIIPANAVQTKTASATEIADSKQSQNQAIFDELKILSALIKSAIEPMTWAESGGVGAIEGFPTNVSLVISQTEEVHQKIADLLGQLRRRFELQVSFETHLVGLPANFLSAWEIQPSASTFHAKRAAPEPSGVGEQNAETKSNAVTGLRPSLKATYLRKDSKEKLLQAAEKRNAPRSMHLPKVTVFQGQSAELHFGPADDGFNLQVRPEFSSEANPAEKRVCYFEYALRSGRTHVSNEQQIKSAMVADGDSLLIDVHEFLSPEVLERHEGQEIPGLTNLPLLGQLFRSSIAVEQVQVHLLITPRILVLKDEEAAQSRP